MAWTQDDLRAIEAAIAAGELTVRFADRMVTYRSVQELLAARAAIMSALSDSGAGKVTYAQFVRGE